MVVKFVRFENPKESQIVKESSVNNVIIPTIDSSVVIKAIIYKVLSIKYNYDDGVITVQVF